MSNGANSSVFTDLGFSEEESAVIIMRIELALAVEKYIKRRGFNQTQAAKFFGITQGKISEIVNGKIHAYSVEYLAKLVAKTGKTPRITFAPKRAARKKRRVRHPGIAAMA